MMYLRCIHGLGALADVKLTATGNGDQRHRMGPYILLTVNRYRGIKK